jgi:hypothetical protein
MNKTIADDVLQIREVFGTNTVGCNGMANYESWRAHKDLCRKMHDDAESLIRISRIAYLIELELVIDRHQAMINDQKN